MNRGMATPNPLLLRTQINNKARNALVKYYSLNKNNTNAMAFLNQLIKSEKRMGMGNFHVALNEYKKNKAKANATPRVNPLARPNANRRRPKTPRGVGRIFHPVASAVSTLVGAFGR
jgi:hypothetical protein